MKKITFSLIVCFFIVAGVGPVMSTSLWEDRATTDYGDQIAVQEGDILMIVVSEDAQARTRSDREREKEITVGGSAGTGEGGSTIANELASWIPLFGAEMTGSSEYESERSSGLSGSLAARMSVTVDEVLHNGTLVLKGQRKIKIEDEMRELKFEGMARKQDVRTDNTIPSDRIANAQIMYEGKLGFQEGEPRGFLANVYQFVKNVLFW